MWSVGRGLVGRCEGEKRRSVIGKKGEGGRGEREKRRVRTGNYPHAALALLAMDAVLQYALERWGLVCEISLTGGIGSRGW